MVWDLPGDLIGPNWVLIRLLTIPEIKPDKNEREGNTEPKEEESKHCCKWNLIKHERETERKKMRGVDVKYLIHQSKTLDVQYIHCK